MSSRAIDTGAMLTQALPLTGISAKLEKLRRSEGVKAQILPDGDI